MTLSFISLKVNLTLDQLARQLMNLHVGEKIHIMKCMLNLFYGFMRDNLIPNCRMYLK
jgi:hypothetical protein